MANILIVDDSEDERVTLSQLLELHGHHVKSVPNGRDALVEVLNGPPDVILLDLLMPEMDGPTFLEVVRSYLRLQSLPVVVYTGLVDSPMIDRAQALKVNSVLIKGKASTEDVCRALSDAIGRYPG